MFCRCATTAIVLCAGLGAPVNQAAQETARLQVVDSSADTLPPLAYICLMAGDEAILEDKPGLCPNPKCRMVLKPVRLVTAYSCSLHPFHIQTDPGLCPIDMQPLVGISASTSWMCPDIQGEQLLEPGTCADGRPRVQQFERRAHGDHNPRHGGLLFMADDNWHHLEGTFMDGDLFRVYFYDDFTRPIAASGFTARAIIKNGAGQEVGSVPMHAGSVDNALEVALPDPPFPLNLSLRVRFKADDRERPFDFTFADHTLEGSGVSRPGAVAPQAPLPTTVTGLLSALEAQRAQLGSLLAEGQLGAVWVPAFKAKDIALALEGHNASLSDTQRRTATDAAKRLIAAAWQIDAFGDLGNRANVTAAYEAFAEAVSEIQSAYALSR